MARFAALAFAVAVSAGCTSTQVPLGGQGALCDYDGQCDPAQGLSCACVVVQNPDDEGPDQIVSHGHCDVKGVTCAKDGGTDASETAADASETGADASDAGDAADSNAMDANDAADASASDAADAVATDADAASG